MRKSGSSLPHSLGLARAVVPLTWLALSAGAAQAQVGGNGDTAGALTQLIDTYCMQCHNVSDWAGGVALDIMDISHAAADADLWESVVHKLRGRLMPPAGTLQPDQHEVDALIAYLETSIDASVDEGAGDRPRVGHVPIHRLSRTELAATLESLIGVDIGPRTALPTEVQVEGFSNIAEALSMSPSFMEQYLSAVRRAVRLAVGEPVPRLARVTIPVTPASAADFPLGTRGGAARGGMRFTHVFPADGEYRFIVPDENFLDAGLYPRGVQTEATLVMLIDGEEVVRKQIGGDEFLDIADRDGPAGRLVLLDMVASSAFVRAGRRDVVITFIQRSRSLSNSATGGGLVTDVPILQTAIEIEGPHSPRGLSASDSRDRIFVCEPATAAEEGACARRIARHMATQAFRRPVTEDEIEPLMRFYEMGRAEEGGFDAGVTELVTAILSSPDFLYRAIPASPVPNEPRLLGDLELATRLSYFLWSTGPDPVLLELAADGQLSDPAVLAAQVDRMLADPRANALVEHFALAWLNLDELDRVEPTDQAFNAALRVNFETEIRQFLASVLLEDRSVVDLIDADWTFVNDALARHYGIPGVYGGQFRRVTLEDENRFGLLGKGAVLMHTSFADRTSPVLRGTWILDRILGTPPAPPPPGVETDLSIIEDGDAITTIRERLEEHRDNPSCQGCHGVIDPPGLALENFDSIGRWRDFDREAQASIDASTTLSSGITLDGPVELRRYLTSRPDQFPMTVTRRLMMYALNREIEYFDMPQVRRIVRDAAASDYTLSALIKGIVQSDAFRHQGPDEHQQAVASRISGTVQARQP